MLQEPPKPEGPRYAQHLLQWPEGGQLAPHHPSQPAPAALGNPQHSKRGWEALPHKAPRTSQGNASLLKIWINFVKKWTYRILKFSKKKKKQTKRKCKQDESFSLKDQIHSLVTGEVFFPPRCPTWIISGITIRRQSHTIPYCSHHFMHMIVSRNSAAGLDTVLRKTRSLASNLFASKSFAGQAVAFSNFGFSYYF